MCIDKLHIKHYNSNVSNNTWYVLRWKILRRDHFTCQYCGQSAPSVILHVDHRRAKTKGGTDDEDNLVTSCSACNIGKSATSLLQDYVSTSSISLGLVDELYNRLLLQGPTTATQLAKSMKHHRANIVKALRGSGRFEMVTKIKRDVYYGIKAIV